MSRTYTNRWGLELKKGVKVRAHHPRGGVVTGHITRLYTMQGYGKRIDLHQGNSFAADDAFEIVADAVRCSKCKTPFPDPMNHTGCCEQPGCSGIAERYYPDDRIAQMTGCPTPPGLTQEERAEITAALEDVCDESQRLRQIVNQRKETK